MEKTNEEETQEKSGKKKDICGIRNKESEGRKERNPERDRLE